MRYVAAYLLAALAGKSPSEKDVRKILDSVGVEIENDKLQIVMDQLNGKDLESLIAEGMEKLASMPSGGGAPAAGASAADAGEVKKEEVKKEESEEESDDDMGFGLFD